MDNSTIILDLVLIKVVIVKLTRIIWSFLGEHAFCAERPLSTSAWTFFCCFLFHDVHTLCCAYLFKPMWTLSFRFVGSLGSIIVKCKDLRVIQLDIPGMEECLNVASSIEVKAAYRCYALPGSDYNSCELLTFVFDNIVKHFFPATC